MTSPVRFSSAQANILLALAGFADPNGSGIFASYEGLCALTRFSNGAVAGAVKYWRKVGVLTLVQRGGGNGNANEYAVSVDALRALMSPLDGNLKSPPGGDFEQPKSPVDLAKSPVLTSQVSSFGGPSLHQVETTVLPIKPLEASTVEEEEEAPSRIDARLTVTSKATSASPGQVEVLPVGILDAFDALRVPPFGSPAAQDLWTRIFDSRNPGELLSQTLETFFDEAKRRDLKLKGDWYTLKRKIREWELDIRWHKESIQERMSRESRESIAEFQRQYTPIDPERAEEIASAIAESHETRRDVDEIMQERRSAKRA
jgi:hypothetical protein